MQKNIDIFDKNNHPTGQQTSVDDAMRKGLWHRGTHITVRSASGKVLVQKRSRIIKTHPGVLDIGSGGVVDAGEEPLQTAQRELFEEVGISVRPDSLHFIGIYKTNHAFPRIRRFSRCFTYCYVVTVPDETVGPLQQDEVEWAQFMTMSQAQKLIKNHRLKGFGRLLPHYGFYKWQLKALGKPDYPPVSV